MLSTASTMIRKAIYGLVVIYSIQEDKRANNTRKQTITTLGLLIYSRFDKQALGICIGEGEDRKSMYKNQRQYAAAAKSKTLSMYT